MIIRGRRIRKVGTRLGWIKRGTTVIIGVRDILRYAEVLKKTGFSESIDVGEAVLPASVFGPISRFNAEGKDRIHRDQPMETAYRVVEWRWKQWRGRYDREEQSRFVDVPYPRYPRTFIPPPSVELRIAMSPKGEKIVVGPEVEFTKKNDLRLLHIINLFLEIFGECNVFTEGLKQIIKAPVRRLNWRVLPPGRQPWSKLRAQIGPIIKDAPQGNQKVIWDRLETINKNNPNFFAIGQAGFRGYIIFGFTAKNQYVCESIYTGNATYVFDERWEKLSKMTKAEILDRNLQTDRIIHRVRWYRRIAEIIGR